MLERVTEENNKHKDSNDMVEKSFTFEFKPVI